LTAFRRIRTTILAQNRALIGRQLSSVDLQGGFWDRVTYTVMRRPIISLVLAVGLLIAAAVPYFTSTSTQVPLA